MGKKFLNFCDDNHIRVDWSAVANPKTNGQVERENSMILVGDSPRGPLKQRGNPHLKPATKLKHA
jgi:hypothetical protein